MNGARTELLRQLAGCFVAQRDQINGLAPSDRFLGAAGRHHLTDYSRQHSRSVLPADQIEALERLIDEVERVPGVGECPFGRGRLAMADVCPTPQPALECSRIRTAFQRCTFSPRRLAVAVRRHTARAVEK